MGNPAETYESYMVPGPVRALCRAAGRARSAPAGRARARCGLRDRHRRPARGSARGTHGPLVGLDLSPGMLAVARTAAMREGLSVDWRERRAEALPFADGEFDLVLCQ
jgi:SAM-dependent methyltransferase